MEKFLFMKETPKEKYKNNMLSFKRKRKITYILITTVCHLPY